MILQVFLKIIQYSFFLLFLDGQREELVSYISILLQYIEVIISPLIVFMLKSILKDQLEELQLL